LPFGILDRHGEGLVIEEAEEAEEHWREKALLKTVTSEAGLTATNRQAATSGERAVSQWNIATPTIELSSRTAVEEKVQERLSPSSDSIQCWIKLRPLAKV